MSEKKPLDDTKATYSDPNPSLPSPPPMDLEHPPTYEQVCAAPIPFVPTPYYAPLPTGKGCFLLLQFPCQDVTAVGDLFKQNTISILLHEGRVVAFIPEIQLLSTNKTSAVIVQFGAEKTALSWLQNMKSSNLQLTSRWLGMIVSNTTAGVKHDYAKFNVISLVVMKLKPDFTDSKARKDEFSKLFNETFNPMKKKHEVWNIVSGKTIFACGDWSSFSFKASELNLSLSLFQSFDHRNAYLEEFKTDPKLERFNALSSQKFNFIFTAAYPIGDIWKFQDL